MSDKNVLIQVKDLKKAFGTNQVLDGITTDICQGEVVAVIGPSGSGKSTFLRSLNLLEVPTGGQILFEGTDITDPKVDINRHRQKIGMVFQQFNLFPHKTVKENIMLAPVTLKLMSKEEALNKIATFTGGRAAEELIFHSITTGASNDIEQATKIARAMVTRYGMTDEFDMVAMETVNNQYLGGDTSLTCSPETARMIDEQVVKIVRTQHEKALNILKENEGKLHEIAKYLLDKETITGEEFMEIYERNDADVN